MSILGSQLCFTGGAAQKYSLLSSILLILTAQVALAEQPDIAVIRPDLQTGFAQAGWKYDRYSDLPSLDKDKSMTVADLKGPGIIRHIHICRHNPKDVCARGIVLEIYFEGAAEPAVQCPLADFFGDGCNGNAMYFSSKLSECAPWSYNTYIPMPFKSRAKVVLRNDTGQDIMDYSYVEWENLPEWNDKLGYFHATYNRKSFQLSKTSDEMFFEIEGAGHVIGRQFSIVTDEPYFTASAPFNIVMEGNNEIDIDGQPRKLDYLGTEDSFGFSWGFRQTFAGLHAGMALLKTDLPIMLSIYRFHDHQPIRFNKSLKWHINWSQEKLFTGNPDWAAAVAKGGGWVDYATVYYWYQTVPGGYKHQPLPPSAERAKSMIRPPLESSKSAAR